MHIIETKDGTFLIKEGAVFIFDRKTDKFNEVECVAKDPAQTPSLGVGHNNPD
jgi:hypothetical protein